MVPENKSIPSQIIIYFANLIKTIKENRININIPTTFISDLLNILSKKFNGADDCVSIAINRMSEFLQDCFLWSGGPSILSKDNFPDNFLEEFLKIALKPKEFLYQNSDDFNSYTHPLTILIDNVKAIKLDTKLSYETGLATYNYL